MNGGGGRENSGESIRHVDTRMKRECTARAGELSKFPRTNWNSETLTKNQVPGWMGGPGENRGEKGEEEPAGWKGECGASGSWDERATFLRGLIRGDV